MKKRFQITSVLLLAVLLLTFVVQGQDESVRPGRKKVPEFEKKIDVLYRLIDVVVTDANGNYVRNLTKDDFEIFDNGKKVDVLTLDEFQLSDTTVDVGQGGELVEYTEGEMAEEQQPPRNIIFLIDAWNTTPKGLRKTIPAVTDFILNNVRDGDRVMMLSYANSLKVLQPFTNQKEELLQTLDKVGFFSGMAVQSFSDVTDMQLETNRATRNNEETDAPDRNMITDVLMQQEQHEVKNYLASLEALAKTLKFYPGRKTLVFLSEGVSYDFIDPGAQNQIRYAADTRGGNNTPPHNFSLNSEYKNMLENFNDAHVSLYTVDVGGLRAGGGADTAGTSSTSSIVHQPEIGNTGSNQRNQDFLATLAEGTGGKFYRNSNDVTAMMQRIEKDISNYYILGFHAESNPQKSEYHDTRVTVKIPGANVVFRKGYNTPKPFKEYDAEERDLHLTEGFLRNSTTNPFRARANFSFAESAFDNRTTNVLLHIPVDAFVPDEQNRIQMELLVSNLDTTGNFTSSVHRLYTIDNAGSPELKAKGVRLVVPLNSNEGRNMVRIAVRDNVSGQRTYLSKNFNFSASQYTGAYITSPVFYDTKADKRLEDEFKVSVKTLDNWNVRSGAIDMFRHPVDGPVYPVMEPVFANGQTLNFMFSVFKELKANEDPEQMDVKIYIREYNRESKSGAMWEVNSSSVKRYVRMDGGGLDLTGSFVLQNLKPGYYQLLTAVRDDSLEGMRVNSTVFILK